MLVITIGSLAACTTHNPNGYVNYQSYWFEGSEIYPEGYDNYDTYNRVNNQRAPKPVEVPESYHVGSYHNPTSHKDRDRSWASRQRPGSYTIELDSGEKAADVARTLHKAPKSERSAQIKYQNGSKTQYKGVYGTYPSYEEAQKAMRALPDDVKKNANIKTWGNIQNSISN